MIIKVTRVKMYMKTLRASDRLKRVHSHVTRVQSCKTVQTANRARTLQNLVRLDFLWCFFMYIINKYLHDFSCNLMQQALVNFSKTTNCTCPYRLVEFYCLWKIHSCLLTPNCTRNYRLIPIQSATSLTKCDNFNTKRDRALYQLVKKLKLQHSYPRST